MRKATKIILIAASGPAGCMSDQHLDFLLLADCSCFTVASEKITSSFRIVFVSDLHNHQFGRENEKLVQKIREQSPDRFCGWRYDQRGF